MSEPGFAGLSDLQDKNLVLQCSFSTNKPYLLIATLMIQTHNPENLPILKILVQTKSALTMRAYERKKSGFETASTMCALFRIAENAEDAVKRFLLFVA